jgi:hypothetical protein
MCQTCKIPTTTTRRSEPVSHDGESVIGRIGLSQLAYLCGNVGDGGCSDSSHAVNARITRPRCLGFLLYRTGRGEYMLECLSVTKLAIGTNYSRDGTHVNENLAPEKPAPRVVGIVLQIRIHQHWPLVTCDCHFTTGKLCSYTNKGS